MYEMLCQSETERNVLGMIKLVVASDGMIRNFQLNVDTYMESADRGYIGVLQYLWDNYHQAPCDQNAAIKWTWPKDFYLYASATKCLDTGEVWNWIMCLKAAYRYQSQVIKWMDQHNINMNYAIAYFMQLRATWAAQLILQCCEDFQNLEIDHKLVTQWELQNFFQESEYSEIMTREYVNFLKSKNMWNESICSKAASNGHLNLLKWARENECLWDHYTCRNAAMYGHLDLLKWAHENGCPWEDDTVTFAAWNGHIHILQWLAENGCPWDDYAYMAAATNGQTDVLEWLRDNGYTRDIDICKDAAMNGELDILKWAHKNGWSWNEETCESAAR